MKHNLLYVIIIVLLHFQSKIVSAHVPDSLNTSTTNHQPIHERSERTEFKEMISNGNHQNPQMAPSEYCTASGGCSEHISRVQFGTIDNVTGCSGYANYTATHSANLPLNGYEEMTITNGAPYAGDQCGVWIDWNKDGDFDDPDETLYVSTLIGKFTAYVRPPQTATTGPARMRIRITWSGTLSPCGSTTYGEVEDYTINITAKTWNYWTGATNNNWDNPGNWSLGAVPTAQMSVAVPFLAVQPLISSPQAYCFDLVLGGNATLTMNNGTLYVMGDFDAGFGQFTMLSTSKLNFNGSWSADWWDDNQNDIYTSVECVKPNESTVTLRYGVTCSGTVNWYGGKLEIANGANLQVTSTSPEALTIQSIGSPFYDATLKMNSGSTVTVNGGIYFRGKSMVELTGGTITCGGNFRFSNFPGNDLNLSNSTLIMNGTGNQYIQHESDSDLILGDLTINKASGKVYIANKNLKVGSLSITSGRLSCANGPAPTAWYNISVSGNWSNNNFPNGFEPGTAKVIFNGPGVQNITTSENFNILEVNRTGAFAVNSSGTNVTCNSYSWVSGGLEVINGATFTALDLAQQGLFGSFRVNTGSTMNLYQDNTQWVDLDANVVFDGGGAINVYGGNGDSWWAFSNDAILTMNGGTLDFKDAGIIINNTGYGLNLNLSNEATIKTKGVFYAYRTGFNLSGGTLEMYGANDKALYLYPGNSLYNLKINKAVDNGLKSEPGASRFDPRSNHIPSPNTRSNSIFLYSDVSVTGNAVIESGNLNLNGYTLNIGKNFSIYGTLSMNNPSDWLNLPEPGNNLLFGSGSTANITAGVINTNGWVVPESGSNFNLGIYNTIILSGTSFDGGLSSKEPTATYGNIIIGKNSGVPSFIDYLATQPIVVSGDFTIDPGNQFIMQYRDMIIHGNLSDASTSAIHLNYGWLKSPAAVHDSTVNQQHMAASDANQLEIFTPVILEGLLNVSTGNVLIHALFNSNPGSSIVINGGSFIADAELPDETHVINGNLSITDGMFEISNSSLTLSGSPKNVSGGIIRTARNFTATDPDIFHPTGGSVEMVPSGFETELRCYNGNYLNNLDIYGSSVWISGQPLIIKKDLTNHVDGYYVLISDIYIEGNWYSFGENAYTDDQTVFFTGTADQEVVAVNAGFGNVVNAKAGGNLTFEAFQIGMNDFLANNQNIIKTWFFTVGGLLDLSTGSMTMPASGFSGVTTENLLMGGLLEVLDGTFTANDIVNNGIYGNITIDGAYAVCDLNQDFSQYIDLNGTLTIHNGLLKISGGSDVSYWPYFGSASLTMDGGTLDFSGPGILINNTGDFTNAISGGTIRTAGSFIVDRADYTPWGGTTELYSDVTSYISTMGGGNLHRLNINKAPEAGYQPVSYKDRNGKTVNMFRGGTVEMTGNVYVAGILNIQEGTLKTGYPGITLTCGTNTGADFAIIEEGGTLELGPLSTLKLSEGLLAQASGKFLSLGAPGSETLITRAGLNPYYFNLDPWATFAADHTIFEYMNPDGIRFDPDSFIEPEHAFNYCTFRNGAPGGTLLTLNNHEDLVSTGVHFAENTAGSLSNVTKSGDQGYMTFIGYTGSFSGPGFENDPFDRIEWYGSTPTQSVNLPAGWSGLSSYIMPAETNLSALFAPVAANLNILQTLSGFYSPSGGINTIGNWESQSAYILKMTTATTLPFEGLPEHNKILYLNSGWNLIPVISNTNVSIPELVSGLGSDFQIIKEVAGDKLYWPEFGISTLSYLVPGKSYFARMATGGSVTFPNNISDQLNFTVETEKELVTPWNRINRTGSGHVIGIESQALEILENGDILGVFTPDGLCTGVVEIEDSISNLALHTYADDPLTLETDGAFAGQPLQFRLYRPSTGQTFFIEAGFDETWPDQGFFNPEGISVIRKFSNATAGWDDSDLTSVNIYPNPTKGKLWLTGLNGVEKIEIVNPVGSVIQSLEAGKEAQLSLDLGSIPPGVYQIRMTGKFGTLVKQVVLM